MESYFHATDVYVIAVLSGVNYVRVRALNKPLKKLEMSIQPTFITLTGIPQQLSVTVRVTTNSGAQKEMKSAEGKEG